VAVNGSLKRYAGAVTCPLRFFSLNYCRIPCDPLRNLLPTCTIVEDGRRVLDELESPDMRHATAPSVRSGLAMRGELLVAKRK
jgi:hypothetical protein